MAQEFVRENEIWIKRGQARSIDGENENESEARMSIYTWTERYDPPTIMIIKFYWPWGLCELIKLFVF